MNVTALLEYLSLLLEYIDLSQHSYDNASYKSFLVASSTLSLSYQRENDPLIPLIIPVTSHFYFFKIMPVAILIILTKLVAYYFLLA